MYEDLIGAEQRYAAQMGAAPLARVGADGLAYVADDGSGNAIDAYQQQPVGQVRMGVRERSGLRFQRQFYGFPRTKIAAGETVKINAQAQVLMKLIRLVIGDDVNANLLVHELSIAKNNLINGDAVIGQMFSPLAVSPFMPETETIQPGCSASIVLENTGETTLCVSVSAIVSIGW